VGPRRRRRRRGRPGSRRRPCGRPRHRPGWIGRAAARARSSVSRLPRATRCAGYSATSTSCPATAAAAEGDAPAGGAGWRRYGVWVWSIASTASSTAAASIAKPRVGWMVLGVAPGAGGAETMARSAWFHSTAAFIRIGSVPAPAQTRAVGGAAVGVAPERVVAPEPVVAAVRAVTVTAAARPSRPAGVRRTSLVLSRMSSGGRHCRDVHAGAASSGRVPPGPAVSPPRHGRAAQRLVWEG
jgi:hypothetical protein